MRDDQLAPDAWSTGGFDRQPDARGRLPEQSWLAVVCGAAGLLLPLNDAGEITSFAGCIDVPHTRPWFLGVANLRGQLQGVVDLGGFLGLRQAGDEVTGGWVVALNGRFDANCVLRVDQLAGLRRDSDLVAVDADPAAATALPRFAGRCLRELASGRIWQEIRLADLVADAHFLDIRQPP